MIEAAYKANMLALFDAYAAASGLSGPVVSQRFYGNRAFLGEFRSGSRSLTLSKYDEMLLAFSSEWPIGARWPKLTAPTARRPKKKIPVKESAAA